MRSSTITYKILNLAQKNKWNDYLSKLPIDQQDIYFTPEYYELYEKNGDGKAQCFVFENNGKIALYPFLINSVNQLGYKLDKEYFDIQGAYGYNGVVSSSYGKSFITAFYKAFTVFCIEKNIIAEFMRFHPLLKNQIFSMDYLNIINNRKTLCLDLRYGYKNIFKNNYNKQVRKKIKKAIKENIYITLSDKKEKDIEAFYNLYIDNMKQVDASKFYYFSYHFIKNTIRLNSSYLILAIHKEKIVGGYILLKSDSYSHNHLSGANYEFRALGVNVILQDEVLKLACSLNCKTHHFGGGNSNSIKDSLFKFKNNFTNDILEFFIGKKIHNRKVYDDVIKQWEKRNSEKVSKYKDFLLKYRY